MLRKVIPFCHIFYGCVCPSFLVFSCGEIVSLLSIPQNQASCWELPVSFFFSKVMPWSVQGCVPSSNLAALNWLLISMCFLFGFVLALCRAGTHHPCRLVHNECGGLLVLFQGTHRVLGAHVSQLWRAAGEVSHEVHGRASSWWNLWTS